MKRFKGERFNPWSDWADPNHHETWILLEDADEQQLLGASARCVIGANAGNEAKMYLESFMFPPTITRSGKLAP